MKNRKVSISFISINVIGVLISYLYGVFGGSGGETTEGMMLGLFYTNILSLLVGIIIAIIKFSWWRSNYYWAILIILIYFPITLPILMNKINNTKKKKAGIESFGYVPIKKYNEDKKQTKIFLTEHNKSNYSVDTLIYSKNLSKIFIICSYVDSSLVYKNFELFALNKKIIVFNIPKGGNFLSEDSNKSKLIKNVFNWYINMYYIDEKDKNSIWNYSDFWN